MCTSQGTHIPGVTPPRVSRWITNRVCKKLFNAGDAGLRDREEGPMALSEATDCFLLLNPTMYFQNRSDELFKM